MDRTVNIIILNYKLDIVCIEDVDQMLQVRWQFRKHTINCGAAEQ